MIPTRKIPFTKTQFTKTIDTIVAPSDLEEYIDLGANVARYQFSEGAYDHIFHDSVDNHTKRIILYALGLPLAEKQKNDLIRTLWIHDIPEILDSQKSLSDMTSTDKIKYPHLAQEVEQREHAIVNRIFTESDKALYEAFEPAKKMLFSGRIDTDKTTPIGLLARILDNFIDGTNSFHGFMLSYLSGPSYSEHLPLPQRDSFEYCFHRWIDVWENISAFSHPEYEETKTIIQTILRDDFFWYVAHIWDPEVLKRLPGYAQEEYQRYQSRLKNINL